MVLAKRENYPNAEERRLFYVALTRAKKKVFLCTEAGNASPFLDEIIQSPFDMEIWGKEPSGLPSCSKCIEGKLTLKDSKNGKFWGCNNHILNTSQISKIKGTVVCGAIFAGNAGTIHTKDDRKMLDSTIVYDMIICSL